MNREAAWTLLTEYTRSESLLKQKSFAAAVSREDIQRGAELLELSLDDHIIHVIQALGSIRGFGSTPGRQLV